ncbi:MAG: hypothetical protein ACM3TR_20735 [Caulobacteraceae bacterium]
MNIRKKSLFLVFLVLLLCFSVVYGDNTESGWKGYGLYRLTDSKTSVLDESDTVTVAGNQVTAVYEYTIKNDSTDENVVNFGYPDNGIYEFSVHDGSKYIKYKSRGMDYLKNNYRVENLKTTVDRWFLFSMVFEPGQSRHIKVTIKAEIKKAGNDTYSLNIFKDRGYPYAILGGKVNYRLSIADFKPYDIVSLEGVKPEQITDKGEINLSYSGSYGSGAVIGYQPVDKMAIDKLAASSYKKPKAISKAFLDKKYNDAITYCNEYINAPSDKNLSTEQVKFIKAESLRLSGRGDEYLQALGEIDVQKLYPGRIRYKIAVDKLGLYDSRNNKDEMNKLLAELIPETKSSYPYMFYWLSSKGYNVEEAQNNADILTHSDKLGELGKKASMNIPGMVLGLFASMRKSWITYIIIGFILGFLTGRITKRNKKKKSVYMFRN